MILAFADDFTVEVFESTEQANGWLESIDVKNREYTFLDERGFRLEPVFGPPIKKKWLWFFSVTDTGPFTFQATEARRDDLLHRLHGGEVKIGRSPARVRSLDELRSAAPTLFHS